MVYQSINLNNGQLLKSFQQFDSAQLERRGDSVTT